jgi:hypothetical protein
MKLQRLTAENSPRQDLVMSFYQNIKNNILKNNSILYHTTRPRRQGILCFVCTFGAFFSCYALKAASNSWPQQIDSYKEQKDEKINCPVIGAILLAVIIFFLQAELSPQKYRDTLEKRCRLLFCQSEAAERPV